MKCGDFLPVIFKFPFHQKKITCSILICFLLVVVAAASDLEFQQSESSELKQLIRQAKKLTRKGEFAEAEKILRQVVERRPTDLNAKLILGSVLLKQGQLLEAYNLSIEVVKADPKNSYAFAVLGMSLLNAGNFKDARISFINALRLDNGEALAWSGLGLLDYYENRISLSVQRLQQSVSLEPYEPDFLYSLAQISARDERYKEAAELYERFLAISPQTDTDRRERIEGLIRFLNFLGNRQSLYILAGARQTKISFKMLNDRPVIQLRLKKTGEPLNFVLDTGSGVSVISEKTANQLKIKPVARGGKARGIGGDGKFEIVYGFLPAVYIGDVKIKGVPVYIRKFHSTNEQIHGYVGLSLISKFLTTIDYGDLTFSLANQSSAEKKAMPGEKLSLPLRLTSSGFLSGEVEVEGVQIPLNFIVDTGASISVISEEIAATKEISRFMASQKLRVVGAAGVTDNVSLFTLPRISFGAHSRESVSAVAINLDLINEASGFRQAGILGGNFLKNYRLTFDFKNSEVVFVPINE